MIGGIKKAPIKILLPVFYTAAIFALVLYQWNEQLIVWQGGTDSFFKNLMEYPAYIRHGFDPAEIKNIQSFEHAGSNYMRFKSPQLRINKSPLPDLPKRKFLNPKGMSPQEFTIIIPIEIETEKHRTPGVFLGYIGENWEVYINGELVKSEMHLDKTGQITNRRNWRDVHFPIDKTILVQGSNILAFRIIGDPTFGATGFYYSSPYYLDDYTLIKERHLNIIALALFGVFGYTGIYYLIIFLNIRKKQEIYYLYYSLFSILLCIYTLMRNGIVNSLIPNSDISIRLEFLSLFMMVPMIGIFLENFGWRKVTKITRGVTIFYAILGITQVFFCTQYGAEVLMIWSWTVFIYFSYIFFYDIIYFYFWKHRKSSKEKNIDVFILNTTVGSVLVYICGLWDIFDTIFFHFATSLFLYSTFVFHIGMAITLSQRFRMMYHQLEEQVRERTMELKEQTAIAQEASKAKSNFLSIMSHEIRTPLNAVIGFSEIELRGNLPPLSRENISHIHQSGSMLLGIINEILDLSKIESGKLDLLPCEYDCASLISGTVGLNKVRIGDKPIKFILEIDSDFPAKLMGDELRVRQILNNLLSNAIKYTNEGTVKLIVKKEQIADKSNHCLIRFIVSDIGIGIRPEDTGKLFDNYMQFDTQANRKVEGTGLGLAIAKNLTQMMGGGVNVQSEYGKGSVFTAWIIQEQKNPNLSIGEITAKAMRKFRYTWDRKEDIVIDFQITDCTVLIVDDLPINLLVAKGLLKSYGAQIDTASSGREAIELVKEKDYDIIFMDHMMPEMDGLQTGAAIRALGGQMPIIAMTSNAMRGIREFYLEQGFNDYLSKPINMRVLDEILKKWVNADKIQKLSDTLSVLPPNFYAEVTAQQLDKFNHFRAAFESGLDFDEGYYQRFCALLETVNISAFSVDLQEQATALIEAGRLANAHKIREKLPAFCEEMEKQLSANSANLREYVNLQETLQRLKNAIYSKDAEIVEAIIGELGTINLPSASRELYFLLYDLLLTEKTEEALGAITLWERIKY